VLFGHSKYRNTAGRQKKIFSPSWTQRGKNQSIELVSLR
jgi:hypothetical protein